MPRGKQPFPADAGGEANVLKRGALFHRLNNQLGIILANAELLEQELDEQHGNRARASQIVTSTIDAISTAQDIRVQTQQSPE